MRKSIKVVLAAVSTLLICAPAYAFHSGGVAECEGCHTMHNSLDGAANATGLPQYQSGGIRLLPELPHHGARLEPPLGDGPSALSGIHIWRIYI